jgi:hypothetical protein
MGCHVAQALLGGVLHRHVAADRQQLCAVGCAQRQAPLVPGVAGVARGSAHARLHQHRIDPGQRIDNAVMQRSLVCIDRQRSQPGAQQWPFLRSQAGAAAAVRHHAAQAVQAHRRIAGRFHETVQHERAILLRRCR